MSISTVKRFNLLQMHGLSTWTYLAANRGLRAGLHSGIPDTQETTESGLNDEEKPPTKRKQIKEINVRKPWSVTINEACLTYKAIAESPIINSGQILSITECADNDAICDNELTCSATFQQKDLELNTGRHYERFYTIRDVGHQRRKNPLRGVKQFPFASELHGVVIQTYSPDGKWKAVIRDIENKNGKDQYLEIWSQAKLVRSINLTEENKHGRVHGKGTFASLQWSNDNQALVYIAEKKKRESLSFFDSRQFSVDSTPSIGDKFLVEGNWGEQMDGLSRPSIITYELSSDLFTVIEDFPSDISPGQAIWGPDDSIIFVGWVNPLHNSGLMFTEARENMIFQVKRQGNRHIYECLSDRNGYVGYPRLSPDGTRLVYLHADPTSGHGNFDRLMIYNFFEGSSSLLCNEVKDSCENGYERFPLFITFLASRCWLEVDNQWYVAFQTYRGISKSTLLVCTETKQVTILELPRANGSQMPLDAHKEFLLMSADSLTSLPELRLLRLSQSYINCISQYTKSMRVDTPFGMQEIHEKEKSTRHKNYIARHVLQVPLGNTTLPSLLLTPRSPISGHKPPLVAWIHGGPHMIFPDTFNLYPAVLCSLGFAVLLVNYRGSIGFDHQSMKSLLGKIKYQDTDDCLKIVEKAIKDYDLDYNNVFAYGGSHGGFIVTHLTARLPDFFRSVVTRNSPFNLADMNDATDIKDWCYRVCELPYTSQTLPKREDYHKMLDVSPLFDVDKIKTPFLMCVGSEDVRISPSQATNFYGYLKTRGVKSRLLLYPDGHLLSDVEVEADMFVNIFKWFKDHLVATK